MRTCPAVHKAGPGHHGSEELLGFAITTRQRLLEAELNLGFRTEQSGEEERNTNQRGEALGGPVPPSSNRFRYHI